ncbi:transcriptional regulator TyrR [Escherichia coli]
MRLEVFCEDRLGLTRELLDLLVLRGIDLRGIEIDPIGRIYLNFAELEFESFSSLMAEIRRIAGVTDVRTVPWMPSEREHLALSALLEALPEPVLSVDMKSKVDMANPASCQLFGQKLDRLRNHTAAQLINGFNFLRWLESEPQDSHNEHVVINGQNFLMEITPVYLQDENDQHVLTGAVVMLRSTIRMGRQLQNVAAQDVSAFSQIVAVSPKMKHVVEQAQKLAMLSAPLLITGDTGTGKDLFAYACHQASPRAGKPYLALNCASIPEDAVESELFGHAPEGKKGFFEQANGGSVLLDEIGEMSPRMQAKSLAKIEQLTGVRDPAGVACEPFRQWVIEDNFVAGRPEWEKAGAELVSDVLPYEEMKLRMLNGSHSFLAYLGYLAGYQHINDCMEDEHYRHAAYGMMLQEQAPTLKVQGVDLQDYANRLIARYSNPALRHRTWQIAMDGSQKLPQRMLDSVRWHLAHDSKFDLLALGVAGWMRYVGGVDEQGNPIEISDPLLPVIQKAVQSSAEGKARVQSLLAIKAIFGDDLPDNSLFTAKVTEAYLSLLAHGAKATVAKYSVK